MSQKITPAEKTYPEMHINLMKISSTEKILDDIASNLMKFLSDRDLHKQSTDLNATQPLKKNPKTEIYPIPDVDHVYRTPKVIRKPAQTEISLSRDMVDFDHHLLTIVKTDFQKTFVE